MQNLFYLLSGVTVEVGAEAGATAARKKRRRRRKRRNAKGQARLAVRTTPHQAHPLVRSRILSWLSIQQLFKLQNLAWNKYLPRCMRLPTRPAILLPLSRSENCTLAIYPPVGSALRHPTFHTIISQSFKILHACFHISGCVWYVVIMFFFGRLQPATQFSVNLLCITGIMGNQLQDFLNTTITSIGMNTQPGNPIVSTWVSQDGHFAFCEFRTIEETNSALLLNGWVGCL